MGSDATRKAEASVAAATMEALWVAARPNELAPPFRLTNAVRPAAYSAAALSA